MSAMGSPTQKMWMTTPITIIWKENGYLLAAERKWVSSGRRQRHHDAVHEEIHPYTVQNSGENGVLTEEFEPASRHREDSGR